MSDQDDDDDAVGYKRPPKSTRFKTGKSGNPKGRPRGTRNFKTDVKATLRAPVSVTRDGKRRKVTTQEASLLRLREKALAGDQRALDQLLRLAQAYNDEEQSAASVLSENDATLLEIFKTRVLSGATHSAASDQEENSP